MTTLAPVNNRSLSTSIQELTVKLNIPIPSDSVLISKVELLELKQAQLSDLEKKVNRKHEWIKENILYPTMFRKVLDVNSGGFVFYPQSKGQTWSFHAAKMAKFLDENFHRIFSN